ncbi:histone-like nucleoid-structuring protein Lsr2 [Streptomyces sp. NPDC088337]|uniref:Lsr2 family DNA-binding protein n=1 Tax=unclassified Streptomyces TaxID=2593676 RepID=UPI0038109D43
MAGEILVAKVSASVIHGGRTIILTAGKTTVRAGHALLTGREHMFMPLHVDYDVEDSGEPGDDSGGEPEGAMAQTMRASVAPDDTEAAPEDAESEPEQAPEPEPEPAPRPDAKTVRAWAAENGVDVPARGKIPDSVYEQYQAAQD